MSKAKKLLAIFTAVCMMALIPLSTLAEEVSVYGVMPDITEVQLVDIQTKDHSLALDIEGHVWAWGTNRRGEWGVGFTGNAPAYTHVRVRDLEDVVQVAVGVSSSYALRADGTVWAWGWNSLGELGDGTTTDRALPTQVVGLDNVQYISAGAYHCLALKEDGTVWAWGYNRYGQLGNGSTSDTQITPVQVRDIDRVNTIHAMSNHSYALRQDGTVWAWGYNGGGELGIGTTNNYQRAPVQVERLLHIEQMGAGDHHGIALKEDGTVWTWGNNSYGSVGDGTTTRRPMPVQLTMTDVQSVIAGGGYHSYVYRADGTVWAWGYNRHGQLGLDDYIDRLKPTQISSAPAAILSTGQFSTIYAQADGSIWGCGSNISGQLRMDDPTVSVATPSCCLAPAPTLAPELASLILPTRTNTPSQ